MVGYIVIEVVVVIAAAAAVAWIARTQANSRRKKLRLEVTNLGNVRSRYELEAEDPAGDLEFEFALDGDPLPRREVSGGGPRPDSGAPQVSAAAAHRPASPAGPGAVQQKVGKATGLGGSIAQTLGTVGAFLPASLRAPLDRMSGRIRGGQVKVQRAQQVSGRVTTAKSAVTSRTVGRRQVSPQVETVQYGGPETPFVRPGESLALELVVRAARPGRVRHYPFSVSSRSVEQDGAPWVQEEGSVHIRAATGLRRFLPYVIVLAVTAVLLVLVVWLASTGGLG
jgi:hypothetical protein